MNRRVPAELAKMLLEELKLLGEVETLFLEMPSSSIPNRSIDFQNPLPHPSLSQGRPDSHAPFSPSVFTRTTGATVSSNQKSLDGVERMKPR
jgi:hypothetical protein